MKYTVVVEETLKYDREVVIEVPDDMDEDDLDDVLDTAERTIRSYGDIDYLYSALESHDVKVVQRADDDTHYPKGVEYEIYDVMKSDEEEDEG